MSSAASLAIFESQGFLIFEKLEPKIDVAPIENRMNQLQVNSVGSRNLLQQEWCQKLAAQLQCSKLLRHCFEADCVPVQCTYFEKSIENNWNVPLHQDVSIPVSERVHHEALKVWSHKEDVLYVQAPFDLLSQLVSLRFHIDECGLTDGPLRVIPGSHASSWCGTNRNEVVCPVTKGGVMLMRPFIHHASSKATGNSRRRVLHFLYGPRTLPFGLHWAHES
jgi:ectoine hydroxylase-related dioxygenase (phytanoyl-CoA dioxygenase family)